jgi:hypothetical protein
MQGSRPRIPLMLFPSHSTGADPTRCTHPPGPPYHLGYRGISFLCGGGSAAAGPAGPPSPLWWSLRELHPRPPGRLCSWLPGASCAPSHTDQPAPTSILVSPIHAPLARPTAVVLPGSQPPGPPYLGTPRPLADAFAFVVKRLPSDGGHPTPIWGDRTPRLG